MKIFITTEKNVAANVVIQMGEKKNKLALKKLKNVAINQWHTRPWLFKRLITLSTGVNLYPVNSAIGFPNTFPLDGDLSSE